MEQDTSPEQDPLGQIPSTEQDDKSTTQSDRFLKQFRFQITDIQTRIDHLPDISKIGGEQALAIDHIQGAISRLADDVKNKATSLPAYDQKIYADAMKALQAKFNETKASLAPKSKFSFKSGSMFTAKKNESAISLNDAAELAAQRGRHHLTGNISSGESSFVTTPASAGSPALQPLEKTKKDLPVDLERLRQPSFSASNFIHLDDEENMHIRLPISASHATSSGTLQRLSRCVVDMVRPTSDTGGHPFATLTLKSIKDCLINCGRVNGACHVTGASNSIIVVTSRQFRMHESKNCDVYLLVTSRPIIEDCERIRFAPLPELYLTDETMEMVEGNHWSEVDDFKWLRSEASPNWSVLREEDRIQDNVWRDVVPGSVKYGVEEILAEVGITGEKGR